MIAGAICVVAEINPDAAQKRHEQGWVDELFTDLSAITHRLEIARAAGEAVSLAYVGNIVDLWQHFVEHDVHIDLGSDQTSLHLPYAGGYYPAGHSYAAANRLMREDPKKFKSLVQSSICDHLDAIDKMCERGMKFGIMAMLFCLRLRGWR